MPVKFISLTKSDRPEKKLKVVIESAAGRENTIYFGDALAKDYTTHNPLEREERKRRYLIRHRANENWRDPETAGFWSRWILWGPHPNIQRNLQALFANSATRSLLLR